MGKYAALLTLALGLGMTILAHQGMQTDLDTSEDQATRQETILARQIARSAFGNAISELKGGLGGCCSPESGEYEGGSYEVTYPSQGKKIIDGRNWRYVDVRVTGTYGGSTYKITATAGQFIRPSFDGLTAESVNFDISGPGCGNDPCISGYDAAGGEARHGISLSPNKGNDPQGICEAFKSGGGNSGNGNSGNGNPGTSGSSGGGSGNNVVGVGSGCSVAIRDSEEEKKTRKVVDNIEQAILEWTDENPSSDRVQTCDGVVGCSLQGNTQGEGVLYVEEGEDLVLSGNTRWDGLIYVADGGSVRINGGGNAKNINGALMMEENVTFELSGGGAGHNVLRNTKTLLDLIDVLPMLGEPVQILNRNSRVVQQGVDDG